jgi:hypothetical protein
VPEVFFYHQPARRPVVMLVGLRHQEGARGPPPEAREPSAPHGRPTRCGAFFLPYRRPAQVKRPSPNMARKGQHLR